MMRKCLARSVLIVVLSLISLPALTAELIKNIRVREGGEKYYFVMFQSEVEPSLWYCGQVKPQVLIRKTDNLELPEISLIKFQRRDLKNPEKLNEGARFRMHLSLGPSEKAFKTLEKKAASKAQGKPVRLSPVPFAALKLVLQNPRGEDVELNAEPLSGISQRHSSQNVAFSTTLGKLESDLLDSLLRGKTGAKYKLYYNYQYADPVLTGQQTPATIEQRQIEPTDNRQPGSERKLPGSRDFTQITRQAKAKTAWELAGEGFIGFANYDEEVQQRCIFIETNPDVWGKAYLTLPLIQQPDSITIDRIKLEVTPAVSGKKAKPVELNWTLRKGWRDRHGAPLVYAVFDLEELRKLGKDLSKATYEIRQTVFSNQTDELEQDFSVPIIVGDAPISDPLTLADVFELQTGFLDWSAERKSGLQRIEIKISEGDWHASRIIKPEFKNGRQVGKDVHQWLIKTVPEQQSSDLEAEIFMVVAQDGKEEKIPWKLNGKNLRTDLPSLSYIFFDQDWQNQ